MVEISKMIGCYEDIAILKFNSILYNSTVTSIFQIEYGEYKYLVVYCCIKKDWAIKPSPLVYSFVLFLEFIAQHVDDGGSDHGVDGGNAADDSVGGKVADDCADDDT